MSDHHTDTTTSGDPMTAPDTTAIRARCQQPGYQEGQSLTDVFALCDEVDRLRAALDATPKVGLTICAQPNGKATSYRGAADMVMATRVEIGAEAYDLHGLRYAAAAELAAIWCSDELIASVTGHSSVRMLARYAGPARQKARAKEAQSRREGGE